MKISPALIEKIIFSIVIIFIAILIYKVFKYLIDKIINVSNEKISKESKKKLNTIKILIFNIIKYVVITISILFILSKFGVNVTSIVAGLGITTALIGLAFQDLAKDIIAGVSIIIENQYEIGDYIEVNGFMGEVIFIGLKNTKIRNFKGATYIIANRNMDKVINYSLYNSRAVVDIDIDYMYNPDEIINLLEKFSLEVSKNVPYSKNKIEVLGLSELNASSVRYTLIQEVEKTKYTPAERFIKKELKKYLDKNNIKIPFDQIEVHNGK